MITTHAGEEGGTKHENCFYHRAESAPYFPNIMLGSPTTTSGNTVQIVTPIAWKIRKGTTPR